MHRQKLTSNRGVGTCVCFPCTTTLAEKYFSPCSRNCSSMSRSTTNDVCSWGSSWWLSKWSSPRHQCVRFDTEFWQEFAEPCRPDMFSSDICCSGTESAGGQSQNSKNYREDCSVQIVAGENGDRRNRRQNVARQLRLGEGEEDDGKQRPEHQELGEGVARARVAEIALGVRRGPSTRRSRSSSPRPARASRSPSRASGRRSRTAR